MGNQAPSIMTEEGIPEESDPATYDDTIYSKSEPFPVLELPFDKEGFVQSFNVEQIEEYKAFFEKYGFVIVDKVIDQEAIDGSIEEVWAILEASTKLFGKEDEKVNRNDSNTWVNDIFPGNPMGIVGGNECLRGKYCWQNRQNPNIYSVFSNLYGSKTLWSSIDRWGFMRPTKNVPMGKLPEGGKVRTEVNAETSPDLEAKDHPDWKTKKLWLHWDLNPWKWTGTQEGVDYAFKDFITENNGSKNDGKGKLQGILNLVDSRVGDGGFCCVPGFHRHLKDYCKLTRCSTFAQKNSLNYSFVNVHPDDPLNQQAQKISVRAGSLIVWSSELPHCNYPNDSSRFRVNQYIKMFEAQEGKTNTDIRRKILDEVFEKQNIQVTDLGKKLFYLEDWDTSFWSSLF